MLGEGETLLCFVVDMLHLLSLVFFFVFFLLLSVRVPHPVLPINPNQIDIFVKKVCNGAQKRGALEEFFLESLCGKLPYNDLLLAVFVVCRLSVKLICGLSKMQR